MQYLIFFLAVMATLTSVSSDLLLVGQCSFVGSIYRLPIIFTDMLKRDLSICCKHTNTYYPYEIPGDVRALLEAPLPKELPPVSLLTDVVWLPGNNLAEKVPDTFVKYAYSMNESSRLIDTWVTILNSSFDAVIVPDAYNARVYSDSGVKIPIFTLPLPIYLQSFLSLPEKKGCHTPFVFGCTAFYEERKNAEKIIDAFCQLFKNNPAVVLKMHSKSGYRIDLLQKKIAASGATNIELIVKPFSQEEYTAFIGSLDCYVFLSKGEGFSVTPREALAAGVPCILSNNTAHKTICASGYVYSVSAQIKERALYDFFGPDKDKEGIDIGYRFNCTTHDAVSAMKKVYQNYPYYLKKARSGRQWVQQYLPERLRGRYCMLLKPTKIVLGNSNKVTESALVTSSKKLYEKLTHLH